MQKKLWIKVIQNDNAKLSRCGENKMQPLWSANSLDGQPYAPLCTGALEKELKYTDH
jgi:hypothetical protein